MSVIGELNPWLVALIGWLVGGMILGWVICCITTRLPGCEAFLNQNLPTSVILLFACGPVVWFAVAWSFVELDGELARIARRDRGGARRSPH